MRYGLFVHYLAGEAFYMDGTRAKDINEAADHFDVPRFVEEVASMRVEYVIFTAWHALAIPLYPSEVTRKWRPDKYIRRDLMGEIIDGLRNRGIRVILYTHPRDGHDFTGEDRINCGWGKGVYNAKTNAGEERPGVEGNMSDSPNPDTFDYEKWNDYTISLYQELIERYGSRIEGVWTDGMGPGRFLFGIHHSYSYEYPVINYMKLRQTIKGINPDLAMIQNSFGYLFSDDFTMTESFFNFETTHKDTGDWPACDKATAFCFSDAGWAASGKYGSTKLLIDRVGMTKYIIFQSTCASAGGTCLAAGPYCGGGWDEGIVEYMREIGSDLEALGDSIKNIVPSTSWPTISGDNMKSKNYLAACSSDDRVYEYIHILKAPADGVIKLPAAADGAVLANPSPITPGVTVADFVQNENGVSFRIVGKPDEMDTVIRFRREDNPNAPRWIWINDNDKRIRYKTPEEWTYDCLKTLEDGTELTNYIGCYEADTRRTSVPGARFDTYFEGDEIELIVSLD
ncbi:MAG: alpha-L-fucosidase, partial [Clostridia bacterium]